VERQVRMGEYGLQQLVSNPCDVLDARVDLGEFRAIGIQVFVIETIDDRLIDGIRPA